MAFHQTIARPERRQRLLRGEIDMRLGLRRAAIVQSYRRPLAFDQHAGKHRQPARHLRAQAAHLARHGQQRRVGVALEPPFQAMQAGGGEAARREQPVDVGQGAPADQGEGTAKATIEAIQQLAQVVVHRHGVRMRREVEERAVDVREQRDRPLDRCRAGKRRQVSRRRHAGLAAGTTLHRAALFAQRCPRSRARGGWGRASSLLGWDRNVPWK